MQKAITYLLKTNQIFAIYSLPNSKEVCLIVDEQKNTEEGFVIQGFETSEKGIIIGKDVFLKNEEITLENVSHLKNKDPKTILDINNINFMSENEYVKYVSLVIEKCMQGAVKKAVPTRIKKEIQAVDFDLALYFQKLINTYKNAFVNLYFHPNCGLWIGATPELLVKKSAPNHFETFSLAGTKLISKNRDWSQKEKEEQQIVTDYITNILKKNDCKLHQISQAKNVKAGQIEHLGSLISFSSKLNIQNIAKILHPTPAVCGMPLKESLEIIKKVEKKQRKNYSGFIGLNFAKTQQLYVNLRCMQIVENSFLIYVGAGVTKDSNPEKEWQETENKTQTLLSLL